MEEPRKSRNEEAGRGARERFISLGMAILVLALIAVLTGVILLPFYRASAEAAHQSVQAISASPVLGLIRAVHHWASALLLLLGGSYLVYGIFTASYRRPFHFAWIAVVGLVLLFFLLQLTGHLLPWDAPAVSSAAIESGIAENVPVVGPLQARLIRGGATISATTLKIWYGAHIALLPAALLLVGGVFLVHARRLAGGRLDAAKPIVAWLGLLALAAIAAPVPLGPPATPSDYGSFAAPPEWYVLPLHALLNLAQGIRRELAFVGTVVIPGTVVLLLLLLPWLDRRRSGDAAHMPIRAVAGLSVAAVLTLALTNVDHMAPLFHAESGAQAVAAPPVQPLVAVDPALVERGKTLYAKNGCGGCHAVGGKGGAAGPPLDGAGRRHPNLDWQIRHLQDPAGVVRGSTMPPFKQLSTADLRALAMYLLSLEK